MIPSWGIYGMGESGDRTRLIRPYELKLLGGNQYIAFHVDSIESDPIELNIDIRNQD